MNMIFNHNFTDIICPKEIENLHYKYGPGIIDECKFCDKCNIIFIFVHHYDDYYLVKDPNPDNYDCYFYLNGTEIFKSICSLRELNILCEEIPIKLILE